YIGELCRYLVNSPPSPQERAHHLRLACGNGLRPDVWPQFKRRFQIPQIIEFYAATEGNVSLFNFDGKQGAVGRLPWWVAARFPIKIVRFDPQTQQPVRDERGFCIECDVDEPGEVIGKILKDASKPGQRFEGYASEAETDKKILHDVFKKGDSWFRTGDLMRRDKHGYFYFVDRTGDTFRWKGENVATSEVSEAISVFPGILEANVYGVEVPGGEGKAGMAALVTDPSFDLEAFAAYLEKNLPFFARPVFLRFQREIETTSTFKQRKIELQKEGFDPSLFSDPLYYRDAATGRYVKLTPSLYDDVCRGRTKI